MMRIFISVVLLLDLYPLFFRRENVHVGNVKNDCEIFSEIFIGTFNFSNCAFFILGSFLNLSLGIFTNDELTRTETERSCGRNYSSTSITYLTTCSNKNIYRPRSNFPELITTSFCWRATSGPKVNYDIK